MAEMEHCFECDAPTGRAGRGEDSLYAGDFGPYCSDCWYEAPIKLAETILPDLVRAAVQAEHERTREAIAKAHDQRARELDLLDEVMNKGQPVTYSPEANWHRQQAAAIRAMPPQDPA